MGKVDWQNQPCLYQWMIQGWFTLFLLQVDDFAIATHDEATDNFILAEINKHLHLPIHNLGIITKCYVMDIDQAKHYMKHHCTKYFYKMLLQRHPWWIHGPTEPTATNPLPFPSDKTDRITYVLPYPRAVLFVCYVYVGGTAVSGMWANAKQGGVDSISIYSTYVVLFEPFRVSWMKMDAFWGNTQLMRRNTQQNASDGGSKILR